MVVGTSRTVERGAVWEDTSRPGGLCLEARQVEKSKFPDFRQLSRVPKQSGLLLKSRDCKYSNQRVPTPPKLVAFLRASVCSER